MKNTNKEKIYTGLELKKLKKAYRKSNKKSLISKNIIPNESKGWVIVETIIKWFIKIILLVSTPKDSWKNKNKSRELIDRTYSKFISSDSVFIPISLSFYFLVSFVPILTVLVLLLSFISDYSTIFIDVILDRIIPGLKQVIKMPQVGPSTGFQYTTITLLLLTSTWIGSNGWGRFIYLQNYIYGHESLGNFFINRIKGFLIVLSITLYLFIMSVIYIYFYKIFSLEFDSTSEKTFFYITFYIYLIFVVYIGFTLLFKFSPSFKLTWNSVLPGVLIAAIPNILFISSFGFLSTQIDYKKYGSIGTFMYIALFVSSVAYFLFLGLIVNESYYKTYYSSFTIAKNQLFRKRV